MPHPTITRAGATGRFLRGRPAILRTLRAHVTIAFLALAATAGPSLATPFAYIWNHGTGIHVVDVATSSLVTTISVASPGDYLGPFLALSPSGHRLYIGGTDVGQWRVWVIDATTNTTLTNIAIQEPRGMAIDPLGTRLYVASADDHVYVVDTSTNAVITSIPVAGPWGVVVSPDGSRVYTSNYFSISVTAIDTASDTVIGTLPLPGGAGPKGLAIAPSGATLYVTRPSLNGVAVIDTATFTLTTTVTGIGNDPSRIAVNPAGTQAYAACENGNLFVIDTASNTVVANVPVSPNGGIGVTPDGTKLYALKGNAPPDIKVLDATTYAVLTTITGLGGANSEGLFIGPICPGCDDGNPCTADACNTVSGVCTHTNITGPCSSDGNLCTDDVCDGSGSCTHPPVTAGASCNDGLYCNGSDTCDNGGTCVHTGDPCTGGPECADTCNEATNTCIADVSTPCTNDGNACTNDHCDGAGACIHPPNVASCDDGLFCTGVDTCAGGSCQHTGNPCTGGSECADVCNEAANDCFDPSGTPCTADVNPCTLDQCDGVGACAHPAGNAGTLCRPATDQCDVAESCDGVSTICPANQFQPDFTPCDDGDACTTNDVCFAGSCLFTAGTACDPCEICDVDQGCMLPTNPGCAQSSAAKSSLQVKALAGDPSRNALSWKWVNADTVPPFAFGDPTLSGNDFTLCLIDNRGGQPTLLTSATAPGGSSCGTKPCWKLGVTQTSASYKSKTLTPDGLSSMSVKAGLPRKASIKVKGKGALLDLPSLALTTPVTVRVLRKDTSTCWEATFSTPKTTTATQFKAKSD